MVDLNNDYSPTFTIIVPHYQGVVSHEHFLRGIESLSAQTYSSYELLVYHDGPLLDDSVEFPVDIHCTNKRYNNWGHSLRDMGIREAHGEYILHFNPDNVLYPYALEEINTRIEDPPQHIRLPDGDNIELNNGILIFPIWLMGVSSTGLVMWREKGNEEAMRFMLSGFPPRKYFIDCMQLVMKTRIWRDQGGWYDKTETSDGSMYERFVELNQGARYIGRVLGEHW